MIVARAKRSGVKAGEFLDNYRCDERYLLKPEASKGRPGLLEATSPDGDTVLIRVWPRRTKDDEDLVDIWRHELRQLHRLGGYPGAQEIIARVSDAGSDTKGFYIVLSTGQRRPLETLLERGRGGASWLRALSLSANRHRLWVNLKRIARGLEILHNEGLVHRNLDSWAILTSASDNPDFQLTGFEWSLRLVATSDVAKPSRGPEIPTSSFASDWAAFAELAGRIFNVTQARLINLDIPDYDVHESASAAEIRLLRDLLMPNELPRLDGELVSNRIDRLLGALDASKSSEEGQYFAAMRLARDSDLSRSVREASDLTIEIDDSETQLAWIEADLGPTITLFAVGEGDNVQLFARGRQLIYRLKQYLGTNGEATWQFAFCESAEATSTWRRMVSGQDELPATALRFMRHVEARQTYARVRGRTPSWTRQIERLIQTLPTKLTREARVHRALTLLHGIEVAFAAATTFPVIVRNLHAATGTLVLAYRTSTEGDELSRSLGLNSPSQRLREGLEGEGLGEGEGWALTEAARLGQAQAGDVELSYDGLADQVEGEVRFRFRIAGSAPVLVKEGYLTPQSSRGNFVQFRRRSQAIRLLKDHTELLQNLADGRSRIISTHEEITEDEGYIDLDDAKQRSLKELIGVIPMYLLQGPPGVGKTFLIKDLVRRRFEVDRSDRLLITAQGNHALDHLLDELADLWTKVEAPLAVRCRPRDDRTEAGTYDLSRRTADLIADINKSKLAEKASPKLKARLQGLAGHGLPADHAKIAGERRSLEGLVMRAANLVFATTNSADLERLIEERGQFDWTIVEEAGKATGCELVTPLMLSHRRLLIGDHKQLPPFGSQDFEKLLSDAAAVRNALKALPRLVDRNVRFLLDDDLLEFMEDENQDIELLCTEAKRILFYFETALTAELDRQRVRPGGRSIASTLKVQHRMHPTICELVSQTFYKGELTTSKRRGKQAAEQASWLASKKPDELPDLPLVFINMPYERSATSRGRSEQLPRFTNADEIAAVVRVISNLSVTAAAEKTPSLVILAPYARQVRQLKDAVLGDPAALAVLASFKPVARGKEWCSTVDSFQGNEADVVIFSLVRNNRGATIRRALGFVGDRRRFNVLLSRAKQRLVFIGSHEFLQTIARPLGLEDDPSSEFLRDFLKTFDTLIEAKLASCLPDCGSVRP